MQKQFPARSGCLKLQQISLILVGTSFILLLGISGITLYQIRKGFQPLQLLNQQIRNLSPTHPHTRIDLGTPPEELAVIEQTLNAHLMRAEKNLDRERSFSSHVAHELRTPVAELKTLSEIASLYPEDTTQDQKYFQDVVEIANQMETLVKQLLDLNLIESGLQPLHPQSLDLIDWLQTHLQKVSLSLETDVSQKILCETDPDLLQILFKNLLTNALHHRIPVSPVVCSLHLEYSRPVIRLWNQVKGLKSEHLQQMRERFWPLDPSRNDHDHSGLGLTLVQNICALLNIELNLALPAPDLFEVRLVLPAIP